MTKRVFVFDWDGTILDSMERKYCNFSEILKKTIETHHHMIIDIELLKSCYVELSGAPRKEIVNKISERLGMEFSDALHNDFSFALTEKNKIDLLDVELFKDALEFLKMLKHNGKILYISSSVPNAELSYLAKKMLPIKLYQYMSGIYGTDGSFKKGKGHFNKIISNERVEKDEVIFFGDDVMDVNLGVAFGVDTVLVNRTNKNTDYDKVVHRLDDSCVQF